MGSGDLGALARYRRRHPGFPWEFNHDAIRGAAALLGLERPVKVRRHYMFGGSYNWGGAARFWANEIDEHRILVGSRLFVAGATKTLWHELAHAMQAERFGTLHEFADAYRAQIKAIGYSRDYRGARYKEARFEREADAIAEKYANIPLVTPTKKGAP